MHYHFADCESSLIVFVGWGRSKTTRKAVFSYLVSLLKKKKKLFSLFFLDKWI